ncbi:MAG TPA: hypothetical protein VLX59_03915 [Acidimicrobiales bacterium]|nr:hypothetical protein [Acidimicrobiales bacterium]
MLPGELGGPIEGYLAALRRQASDQVAAVYAVGALALGDFSAKQSNVDLVVVGDPPLTPAQLGPLRRAERGLDRAHRRAEVWYTCWEEVAGDGRPGRSGSLGDAGAPEEAAGEVPLGGQATPPALTTPVAPAEDAPPATLATPMTRAILRQDPEALLGPDWPVVGYDEAAFRTWCRERLRAMVTGRKGLLVLRRAVTPMVLEASRLAQGAITGRVFSKSEAGESIGMIVAPRYRRILTDAVGYRRGAQTSMYWGPFERKYDALVLLRDLLEVAGNR